MQTQIPIYIIGAGAIGKVLAVFLKNEGRDVVFLRGSVDHVREETQLITVELESGKVQAEIKISSLSEFESLDGIIVLTNKSFGNEQLAGKLKMKVQGSPIVLLQNGLGVERPFMNDAFPGVYRCVLFVTSQETKERSLRFKPVSVCPIGIEKGTLEQLNSIVTQLDSPVLRFRSEDNIQTIIWKKAIVNCVFNSICPLLEIDNGIFHRNENALSISRRIIRECLAIATAMNISLSLNEVEQSLVQISLSSDGQLISTYQDILRKRQTEIETLNFEIVRIAEELGKGEEVKETRLLGEMIKLKSSRLT